MRNLVIASPVIGQIRAAYFRTPENILVRQERTENYDKLVTVSYIMPDEQAFRWLQFVRAYHPSTPSRFLPRL